MYQKLKQYTPIVIFTVALLWMWWWSNHNPLSDGHQNEYLHVGNAYDLWGALQNRDIYHIRWYMYTGYWPWGFYAVPWPFLGLFGIGHFQLLAGNLIHLIAMLMGCHLLQQQCKSPWMPWILFLCPGVFGSLVRFEPNLANIAWTTLGLGMLVKSESLNQRRWAIGWGACLGIGLMMDRLSILFFLGPAVLPFLWRARARQWKNFALSIGATLLLSAAYYREFFMRHREEIFSQAPKGEIDSAGQLFLHESGFSPFYYLLSLIDSQAGPFLGLLMLWGVGKTINDAWKVGFSKNLQMLFFAWIPATLFFGFVAKKQVFYTLPILVPLSLWAGQHRRWSAVAVVAAFGGWLSLGWGVGPPVFPLLPERWVAPRHVVARPPSFEYWPLQECFAAIPQQEGEILIFSEDDRLFEGYLFLRFREAFPKRRIRPVILDPIGATEFLTEASAFVWMTNESYEWPTKGGIQAQLLADHYKLGDLPPIASQLSSAKDDFSLVKYWPAGEGLLYLFQRNKNE